MLCENKNNELACSDNAYVIEYKERTLAAMGRTNILQEENGGNISMEEELCEEKKEDRAQPKLGDVLEYLKDDSNTKTQNSIVIFENPYPSATSRIYYILKAQYGGLKIESPY
jgi:ERCC4-related helicase